jgi:hypothetical protein
MQMLCWCFYCSGSAKSADETSWTWHFSVEHARTTFLGVIYQGQVPGLYLSPHG